MAKVKSSKRTAETNGYALGIASVCMERAEKPVVLKGKKRYGVAEFEDLASPSGTFRARVREWAWRAGLYAMGFAGDPKEATARAREEREQGDGKSVFAAEVRSAAKAALEELGVVERKAFANGRPLTLYFEAGIANEHGPKGSDTPEGPLQDADSLGF